MQLRSRSKAAPAAKPSAAPAARAAPKAAIVALAKKKSAASAFLTSSSAAQRAPHGTAESSTTPTDQVPSRTASSLKKLANVHENGDSETDQAIVAGANSLRVLTKMIEEAINSAPSSALMRATHTALNAATRGPVEIRLAAFELLVVVTRSVIEQGQESADEVIPFLSAALSAAVCAICDSNSRDEMVKERATTFLYFLCQMRDDGLIDSSDIDELVNSPLLAEAVEAATYPPHLIILRKRSLMLLACIIRAGGVYLTLGASRGLACAAADNPDEIRESALNLVSSALAGIYESEEPHVLEIPAVDALLNGAESNNHLIVRKSALGGFFIAMASGGDFTLKARAQRLSHALDVERFVASVVAPGVVTPEIGPSIAAILEDLLPLPEFRSKLTPKTTRPVVSSAIAGTKSNDLSVRWTAWHVLKSVAMYAMQFLKFDSDAVLAMALAHADFNSPVLGRTMALWLLVSFIDDKEMKCSDQLIEEFIRLACKALLESERSSPELDTYMDESDLDMQGPSVAILAASSIARPLRRSIFLECANVLPVLLSIAANVASSDADWTNSWGTLLNLTTESKLAEYLVEATPGLLDAAAAAVAARRAGGSKLTTSALKALVNTYNTYPNARTRICNASAMIRAVAKLARGENGVVDEERLVAQRLVQLIAGR